MVHKNIVCAASKFFLAACSGPEKESNAGIEKLPELEPEAFTIFTHWLYTGQVELWEEGEASRMYQDKWGVCRTRTQPPQKRAIQSFILGDALESVQFCNLVIDCIMTIWSSTATLPQSRLIAEHWSKLPTGCSISRLMVDIWTNVASEDQLAAAIGRFPAEFV